MLQVSRIESFFHTVRFCCTQATLQNGICEEKIIHLLQDFYGIEFDILMTYFDFDFSLHYGQTL